MSLAQRSVRSVTWTTVTTLVAMPINLIQSILLARLLPVEYFGIFAGVSALLNLTGTLSEFGLTNAFLHRSNETEDEDKALRAYFTLRLLFETAWAAILLLVGWLSFSGIRFYVLAVMVGVSFLVKLTLAPRSLLVRRVEHRRLALLDFAVGILSAVVSVAIAYYWRSIWALMVSSALSFLVVFTGLYLWRPVWKPRLMWDKEVIRYYLGFGSRNVVNSILESALDNLDNLWTNVFLGDLLLGFYSRAFKFATYQRIILSMPVTSVVVGAYAELKYERKRLSRAFFQTNAFLVRVGFLIAGWLAVIAPQFIRLLIGEKWMPMLLAFRLMLVFCMLDPIKVAISGVFVARGVPEKITRIRLIQLGVLVVGLFVLGSLWQISGVALAMDLMAIVGTVLLLGMVREHVDVSYRRLFLPPLAALAGGLGLSVVALSLIRQPASDWLLALLGTVVFCAVYLAVLFLLEGKDILVSVGELMEVSTICQKTRAFGITQFFYRKSVNKTMDCHSYNSLRQMMPDRLILRLKIYFQRYIYPRYIRYYDLELVDVPVGKPTKSALLSYIVHPFSIPCDDPRYYRHINIWHAQEIVRVLNRMGYVVDVIDYRDLSFKPEKPYDLFIGHGGINIQGILTNLNPGTVKIYFATTSYWRFHNQQEESRFIDLDKRRHRSMSRERIIQTNEDEALEIVDGIIGIGNSFTRNTYIDYSNIRMINGTSLYDPVNINSFRDFQKSRQNFIFFASRGNVHKGLDLLLEAFHDLNQHLWVAAPIENEFARIYHSELKDMPNIHLVGWLQPRSKRFYDLMKLCMFCILPSCSEGQSQSVIEAMHYGVIPVVSKMSGVDIEDVGFMIDPVTIEEIQKVVSSLAYLKIADLKMLSSKCVEIVEGHYSERAFSLSFRDALVSFLS